EVFPMKILLDYECEANSKNLKMYSALLDDIFKKDESPLLDSSGKLRVLEEMLYQNESRNKFSTNLSDCKLIYDEASSLFKNKKKLFYKEIDLAIQNIKTRNSIQKQKYHDSIKRKIYNFPLTGKRLGRIYGLSIYTPYITLEEYGQVNVISARVGFGSGNFINVERESNMSGDLHDKGIFILQSYLKGLFPRTQNLGLDISILFEQSNSTIDGDSAIVAELLACLSALSGIEIPTQIAITGAMSQYGEALAVGAVSQKIEAWYEFVSMFGKKKNKYIVYIPEANKENLIFSQKILKLMAEKNFLIKTYTHVRDLIPEIFGISLGILESNGKYTRGSLLERIEQEWDKEKHKN
ncbi:MAG: ATP-dependent protease, partial [Leptospiraceae bacterium]|nr:ATP-dependent protease [Leptospiraceae bacterium]